MCVLEMELFVKDGKTFVNINLLKEWADNPRTVLREDFERLKNQVRKLGQHTPLMVTEEGIVVGGNTRLKCYRELGITDVWVSVVQAKDKAKILEYALSSNDRIGLYDESKLSELVWNEKDNISLDDFKIDLGEPTSLQELLDSVAPTEDPAEDETPEIKIVKAKSGDLFQLGNLHRLMCGDSTKREDVERLMAGEKVDMIFTDPPYGARITEFMQDAHGGNGSRHWDMIEGDQFENEELQAFLEKAFKNISEFSKDNAAWYVWHAMLTQGFFAAAAAAADLILHRQIIWVKPCLILAFGHYHWRHELCFYGWKKGFKPEFYGGTNETTVWEMDYDGKGRMPPKERKHPTQKPVSLAERAITNSSRKDNIVIDFFGGSGTTLIACEKLNRKCRMIEISSHYCTVIIERYINFVGTDAHVCRLNPDGSQTPWAEIEGIRVDPKLENGAGGKDKLPTIAGIQ